MRSFRPNILLVVLDSLRTDRLGCYGHPEMSTPHLDALAAGGVRFANCISESTWTLPSAFTLLTGLAPREHRAEQHRKLPAEMPSLPELLVQAGYETFGTSSNPFVTRRSGLHRGLQTFYHPPHDWPIFSRLAPYVLQPLGCVNGPGASMVSAVRRWVRQAKSPWFTLMWINDSHYPYLCPPPYVHEFHPRRLSRRRRFEIAQQMRRPRNYASCATPEDLRDLGRLCSGATAHVDSLIGRLTEDLARQGLADDTIIVVVSDHGDMLGEHGLIGHGPTAGMYHPLIHVPLLARGPGFAAGVASPALVQLADISETLAAAAGVADRLSPTAAERIDLRVAAACQGRRAAVCERDRLTEKRLARERGKAPRFDFARFDCHLAAVVADGWKLVSRDPGRDELYDLANDPAELHNVIERHPRQAESLGSALQELAGRSTPHASTDGLSIDDAEIVDRRLRDLGYL